MERDEEPEGIEPEVEEPSDPEDGLSTAEAKAVARAAVGLPRIPELPNSLLRGISVPVLPDGLLKGISNVPAIPDGLLKGIGSIKLP